MQTIRELIAQESAELKDVNAIGPHGAAEKLVMLTSLLSSLGAEIGLKRAKYYEVRLNALNVSKSAIEAKIRSESSLEFNEWQEREEMRRAFLELIGAIKYYLRISQDEMKL